MVKPLLMRVQKEPCQVIRTVDEMTETGVERKGGTTIDLADVAQGPNLALTPHPIAIVATTVIGIEIAIIVDTTIVIAEITDAIVIVKVVTEIETETTIGVAMHKPKAPEIDAIPSTIVIDLMKTAPHKAARTIKLRSLHSM